MKLVFTSTSAIVFFIVFIFDFFMQISFAQTPKATVVAPPKPTSLVVEGETLDKKAFQLSGMKDKVALVMFCARIEAVSSLFMVPEDPLFMPRWDNEPIILLRDLLMKLAARLAVLVVMRSLLGRDAVAGEVGSNSSSVLKIVLNS